MTKVYLAGPGVFFSDSQAHFAALRALCTKYGLTAVTPLDGDLPALPHHLLAQLICDSNIEKIQSCDVVLADVRPFRGKVEPDSGTAFEIGLARAFGKQIVMYQPSADSIKDRVEKAYGITERDGILYDNRYGLQVEDFGLPQNLMLSCVAPTFFDADTALKYIASKM